MNFINIFYALLIFTLTLFLFGCPNKPEISIFQTWVNSVEEQSDPNIQCYRTSDFDFPAIRGMRNTYDIREDGTFTFSYTGPTDAAEKAEGTWKKISDTRYEMTFDNPPSNFRKTFNIDVVSLEDGLLKINRPDLANPNPPADVTDLITKKWWNSYEDETDPNNEKCYRPSDFDFPVSRGRNGFEFRPNGTFDYNYPGPTDALTTDKGTWIRLSDSRIKVKFDEPRPGIVKEFLVEVISINDEILKIKPLQLIDSGKK